MNVVDIAAVAEIAHGAGAALVVDGTFGTPVLQRPLELGADAVLHSSTKYFGGHSDVQGPVHWLRARLPPRASVVRSPLDVLASVLYIAVMKEVAHSARHHSGSRCPPCGRGPPGRRSRPSRVVSRQAERARPSSWPPASPSRWAPWPSAALVSARTSPSSWIGSRPTSWWSAPTIPAIGGRCGPSSPPRGAPVRRPGWRRCTRPSGHSSRASLAGTASRSSSALQALRDGALRAVFQRNIVQCCIVYMQYNAGSGGLIPWQSE